MKLFTNFNKFKKILLNNDIELFDYELRIVYKRLCNISQVNTQIGGSINNNQKNISQKFKKMSQQHMLHLINSLISKNDEKINWIFNLY